MFFLLSVDPLLGGVSVLRQPGEQEKEAVMGPGMFEGLDRVMFAFLAGVAVVTLFLLVAAVTFFVLWLRS